MTRKLFVPSLSSENHLLLIVAYSLTFSFIWCDQTNKNEERHCIVLPSISAEFALVRSCCRAPISGFLFTLRPSFHIGASFCRRSALSGSHWNADERVGGRGGGGGGGWPQALAAARSRPLVSNSPMRPTHGSADKSSTRAARRNTHEGTYSHKRRRTTKNANRGSRRNRSSSPVPAFAP